VRADDVSAEEVVELKARVEVAEASMRAAQARAVSAYVEVQRRHVHEATELRGEADRRNAALETAKAENAAWLAFATAVASTLHTQGAPSMSGLKVESLPELLDTYLDFRWQRKTKQQEDE
jgi:malate/lactate dehydrogenase